MNYSEVPTFRKTKEISRNANKGGQASLFATFFQCIEGDEIRSEKRGARGRKFKRQDAKGAKEEGDDFFMELAEKIFRAVYDKPIAFGYPPQENIIFLVGDPWRSPRLGVFLVFPWLPATGYFSYPTV